MSALRIGICGNGTVGGGTIDILRDQAPLLAQRAGIELRLCRLGARRDRDDCRVADDVAVHRDLMHVAEAPDLDVLVECIGGTGLARELVEAALRSGKSVVTANKALIAEHGNELLRLAEDAGVSLLCEAAVAGGIPILKALRDGMAANRVNSVAGIINGTGNFILTEMASGQRQFSEVLTEAQELGYAEADPSFDVDGIDAAHKLAILASMAFGSSLNFSAIYCEGISAITPADISLAGELGYKIKHLGIAKERDGALELRVHPTLVARETLLANVDGVLNAVRLDGNAAGPTVYSGAGAGRLPTASAIVADLVDIARAQGRPIHCLGIPVSALVDKPVLSMDEVRSSWYLRLQVEDRPGVMSALASCMSAEGISIEALVQKAPKKGAIDRVTVVILTNEAREDAQRRALAAISAMPAVTDPPHVIRVEMAD